VIEFVQQLVVNVTEGLLRKAYFEPALIAVFGITLILTARIVNRITSFLAPRETAPVPETRTESIVEIRLGDVQPGSWEMSVSARSQTPPVGVTSSNVVY
jgi:hypothetical protein